MTVDEIDRFAVTVPLIAGSEPIVTLLEMLAVTEPIWAVPAPRVIVPEMGKPFAESTAYDSPVLSSTINDTNAL